MGALTAGRKDGLLSPGPRPGDVLVAADSERWPLYKTAMLIVAFNGVVWAAVAAVAYASI